MVKTVSNKTESELKLSLSPLLLLMSSFLQENIKVNTVRINNMPVSFRIKSKSNYSFTIIY
jgi:hypothetical protein